MAMYSSDNTPKLCFLSSHDFQIDDPEPDIEDVVNYPSVRTFFTGLEYSSEPQYDLTGIERNWAVPTPGNIHDKLSRILSKWFQGML